MFKSVLVTSLLALSIGLTGCGKTAEEKADQGNANIKQMNSLAAKLREEGILLGTTADQETSVVLSKRSLTSKSDDDKNKILAMLKKYRSLAKETLELGGEENVELRGASHLQKEVKICNALIAELEKEKAAKAAAGASEETEEKPAPKSPAIPGTNVA